VAGGAIAATDGGDSNLESPSVSPVLTPGRSTSPSQVDGEDLAAMAERAAKLCKADLVTGMVGEFPELQGIMGGYYARAQGEPGAVADAVRDHYKPVGQGDDVPTAPVTVAVSLADKLDTLASFYRIDLPPTGSRDPFALRRAALGFNAIILKNQIRLPLRYAVIGAVASISGQLMGDKLAAQTKKRIELQKHVGEPLSEDKIEELVFESVSDDNLEALSEIELIQTGERVIFQLLDFFADRLKVQQREAGVRHDLIDAVFALGSEDDLVRLLARVKALQAFVATDEGVNLLAGYKRAANILKSSGDDKNAVAPAQAGAHHASPLKPTDAIGSSLRWSDGSVLGEAESDLLTALNTAEPLAASAIEAEQFEDAMAALASLRAPIDAFFDGVMVNDPDPEKRAFRVGLLTRFRDAVHRVADFSRIEG
jgi:glycyl-tRNA synthetase beta chain